MTKKEGLLIYSEMLNIYSGILFNNQEFENEANGLISYDFNSPEYLEIISKYNIIKIAGKGSSFIRAKRLLHYLAPRLTHCSSYDNHIECNALKLLEYSLNNPEQGINCLNKSKILAECCLALGIYARRVVIMPFSPYDFDNHVVVEIYDEDLGKWIMLDPTLDGYFIDENKTPLGLLEIREKFAKYEFLTFVKSTSKLNNLSKLKDKYMELNSYICKNVFYFVIDKENKFGVSKEKYCFVPKGYKVLNNDIQNLKFRINNIPEEYKNFVSIFENDLKDLETQNESIKININVMKTAPI